MPGAPPPCSPRCRRRTPPARTRSSAPSSPRWSTARRWTRRSSSVRPRSPGRIELPKTPWHRQPIRPPRTAEAIDLIGTGTEDHPLLGARLLGDGCEWRGTLDIDSRPFLADHKVGGHVVVPATALAEMALAAGRGALGTDRLRLEEFAILSALRLSAGESLETRVAIDAEGGVAISSRARGSEEWSLHARGRVHGRQRRDRPAGAAACGGRRKRARRRGALRRRRPARARLRAGLPARALGPALRRRDSSRPRRLRGGAGSLSAAAHPGGRRAARPRPGGRGAADQGRHGLPADPLRGADGSRLHTAGARYADGTPRQPAGAGARRRAVRRGRRRDRPHRGRRAQGGGARRRGRARP